MNTEPGNSGFLRMDPSSGDLPSKNANHKVRRLLGRAYLRENRIPEALEVFLGILKDFPNDADVLFILGNLYRLSGNSAAARLLYRRVLEISPGDPLAEKQEAATQDEPFRLCDKADVISGNAIEELVERLRSLNTAAQVEEIRSAADERTAETNGQPLEDKEQLLPALIELNIRQARAAGSPDLAEALQSLQINLTRQVDDRWADDLLREDNPPEGAPSEDVQ